MAIQTLFLALYDLHCTVCHFNLSVFNNHGLRGSASPVLSERLCQWERGIFDPTESTPLDRSPKNLLLVITSATAVPNLVQIRPRGASGQMGEI